MTENFRYLIQQESATPLAYLLLPSRGTEVVLEKEDRVHQ
jgi:hypothetical protein